VVDEERKADVRPITIGLRGDTDLVVEKGLAEGETVVTQGQLRLAPGMRVSVPGEGGRGGKGKTGS
jgi:multidrug efflux system membrane fusion protein